ncbi:gas vesicle protein [Jatrophihabitans sp.]|uniref:gas vesicle protein n=1 Tax=Jatrophihabitans sp. TaxID=1932789 RepID=UPI002C27B6D3|nr:gas vesicle protein [Jatrophihabitans sp.]
MTLPNSGNYPSASRSGDTLADLLERILDKGIVIAGDVVVNILDIELLTLKLRLLIASVDTAKQMGIDWWQDDPFLSRDARALQQENQQLRQRVYELEGTAQPAGDTQPDDVRGARE